MKNLVKRFAWTAGLSVLLTLGVFIAVCAVYIMRFPDEILLTEHTQHRLAFGVPLRATIRSDDLDARINHKPLNGAAEVFLHDSVWIEAQGVGSATMTLSAFGFPLKDVVLDVLPALEIIPVGVTVGVRINSNGVLVLGTDSFRGLDGHMHNPGEGRLQPGDLIVSANGQSLFTKNDLIAVIESTGAVTLNLRVKRGDDFVETTVTPVRADDDAYRIGSWVRDSTQGIGTITYFNPKAGTFGALGHGIVDVDTKQLMTVKTGTITETRITSIIKGSKGNPGELGGEILSDRVLGQVRVNTNLGIYGTMDLPAFLAEAEPMRVAKQDQIQTGPAVLRSNIAGGKIRDFDIVIESVNRFTTDETKGIVLRIPAPDLLALTGGIVQGMSGSPILQNGKIAGAVTHVFVQDPTRGYGIFIENMLREERALLR